MVWTFEGSAPGSGTHWSATTTTAANGDYQFTNVAAGTYFVEQDPVPGFQISQSVQTVTVTTAEFQGTAGTMIDSFSSSQQNVSDRCTGTVGTSSEAARGPSADIVTSTCNLRLPAAPYRLGVDSNFPNLLDYASNVASTGSYTVNWDGGNSGIPLNSTRTAWERSILRRKAPAPALN